MAPWGAGIATAGDQEPDDTPNSSYDKSLCFGWHPTNGVRRRIKVMHRVAIAKDDVFVTGKA